MAKNIVVLSDGTGNSASSPFKTNVWRLYQAIDIQPPGAGLTQQVVFYDNGVGTETFKPLAALGGAIGLGVWQNVRDIYTFVSRNYQEGDSIYGFGFSRGAFTIRLLMGLIGKCGVLEAASENDLNGCVQMAYEAFRRDFLLRASKQRGMIYHRLGQLLRPPKYLPGSKRSKIDLSGIGCKQHFPDIRFVGVWDTVDAYGLPMDELKTAVDNWVWPMSFADRDPSPQIKTLRHALSLDDARPTFRPVLWNEVLPDAEYPNDREKDKTLSSDSIQQVWFAGVHANVGGGYPDDGLAFTALDWMMREAKVAGLRYESWIEEEIAARVNPHGEEYDSRAGIAGYYRFGPRDVSLLSNDAEYKVKVPKVRVSPEAFKRITAKRRDYAPVSISCDFDAGAEAVKAPDAAALENARDLVWWRRIAYFVTLGLTIFLVLFVLGWVDPIVRATEHYLMLVWNCFAALIGTTITNAIVSAWSWLLDHAGGVSGWISFALPSFRHYPLTGLLAVGLLALVFFRWSPELEKRIETHAEWAWAEHKFLNMEAQPKTGVYNAVARPLRPITAFLYRWVWRKGVVNLLGILLGLLALLVLSPYWLWRLFIRPIFYRPPWLTRLKLPRTPA